MAKVVRSSDVLDLQIRVIGDAIIVGKLRAVGAVATRMAVQPAVEEIIKERTAARFARSGPLAKKSPDGRRWKKLYRSSGFAGLRGNADFGDILVDSGQLRDAIQKISSDFTRDRLTMGVGSGMQAKARTHQLGGFSPLTGGEVEARPFLGFGPGDVAAIRAAIAARLQIALETG